VNSGASPIPVTQYLRMSLPASCIEVCHDAEILLFPHMTESPRSDSLAESSAVRCLRFVVFGFRNKIKGRG